MKRRWLIGVPLAVFAFLGGIFIHSLTEPKDEIAQSPMIGPSLPAFDFPAAIRGRGGLSSKDFVDGKPRMLNLFASWCIPCVAEAPMLKRLKNMGVEINALAINDKPDDVAAFLARNGDPYARIGAADMAFPVQLGSSGLPETLIINGKGQVVYRHIGDIRAEDVTPLLARWKAAK